MGSDSSTAVMEGRRGRSFPMPASRIPASPPPQTDGRSGARPCRRASWRHPMAAQHGPRPPNLAATPRATPSSSAAPRSPMDGWCAAATPLQARGSRSYGRRPTGAPRGRVSSTGSPPNRSDIASSTTAEDGDGTQPSPTCSTPPTAERPGGNVFVADLWFVSGANGFAITRRGERLLADALEHRRRSKLVHRRPVPDELRALNAR